jgi:cytosine/adenosine deaminase-related metal-dependent hydrolase
MRLALPLLLLAAAPGALLAHPAHDQAGFTRGLSQDPPGAGERPVPKEQLLVPPAGADHYVVVSSSAKHGDIWRWKQADGSLAYRQSQSLRGWITETDAVVRLGVDGVPVEVVVRGVTPSGNAAETFRLGPDGRAKWSSLADSGEAAGATGKYYIDNNGPVLLGDLLMERLAAAEGQGIATLPSGQPKLERTPVRATVTGPAGQGRTVQLAMVSGFGLTPYPLWLEGDRVFGSVGWISVLPAGWESAAQILRPLQDKAEAAAVQGVAKRFLDPANRAPVLFDNVLLFDAEQGRFLPGRAVLVQDGKVAAIGAAGTLRAPAGGRTIDGKGKSLVPGLWDAHRHIGGDWSLVSNMAAGITSFRSPGTMIDRAQDVARRRAAGELLMGEGWVQAIVDRKDPLAAQGATTVSSAEEAVAAVRKIKEAGLWGVKFYTSMDPSWIAPAAAEARCLGLHVSGHVPATMRPLEAVRAGYQELTHINFVVMQLMPKEVVDKANTAARIEGPAKYARQLDLNSAEARAMLAELKRSGTWVDPTLVVFESTLTSDGGVPGAAYAPYHNIVPPLVARGMRAGGHPLVEDLTRDDYRASFAKLVELVGALHKAGIPIVAGTDGEGMELVRELELYVRAGLTPAEALRTATLNVARLVGAEKRTGSIAVGKEADMVLVDGDVSRDLGALRRTLTVVSDGVVMDADALRAAAGYSGRPR